MSRVVSQRSISLDGLVAGPNQSPDVSIAGVAGAVQRYRRAGGVRS
jgi:hypothetical protein